MKNCYWALGLAAIELFALQVRGIVVPQAAASEEDDPEVSKIIQLMTPMRVEEQAKPTQLPATANNWQFLGQEGFLASASNLASTSNKQAQQQLQQEIEQNVLRQLQQQRQAQSFPAIKAQTRSAAQKKARRTKILQSLQNAIRRAQRDPKGRAKVAGLEKALNRALVRVQNIRRVRRRRHRSRSSSRSANSTNVRLRRRNRRSRSKSCSDSSHSSSSSSSSSNSALERISWSSTDTESSSNAGRRRRRRRRSSSSSSSSSSDSRRHHRRRRRHHRSSCTSSTSSSSSSRRRYKRRCTSSSSTSSSYSAGAYGKY